MVSLLVAHTLAAQEKKKAETAGNQKNITKDLICYYSFDKIQDDTIVPDDSGSGLNAEIVGDLPTDGLLVPGVFGSAIKFNADWKNMALKLPNDEKLDLGKHFTICFWMKPDAPSGVFEHIICKADDKPDSFTGYRLRYGWNMMAVILGIGDAKLQVQTGYVLRKGNWRHVAVTFNGKSLSIFVNGQLEKSTENEGEPKYCAPNKLAHIAGAFTYPTLRRFSGLLDELRFYGRALSSDEILTIMNME